MRDLYSLIDGGGAESPGRGRRVCSPFDGRVVATVHSASASDIEAGLASASAAREPMRALPHHERARILDLLASKVADARETFAKLLMEEAGKPIALARIEADRCVQTITEAARCARLTADESFPLDGYAPGANKTAIIRRFPIGVIVAITPFNFPLNLVAHKIAPAIAAGCPLILKPSSQTPSTGLELARLANDCGLPQGALSVLLLGGGESAPLVDDPRVAMITFTGSAEVGWGIKSRSPSKRVTLELGGNAAAIVEPDAEIETAAKKLANGAFAYAGQSCISVQRIFVHERVASELIDALVGAAQAMIHGDPSQDATMCGPLIDPANAERVMDWIAEARTLGAQVLCGGTREGNVIAPTIVANAPNTARLNCNEVFGPVVNVTSYSDFDQALAMVNDSQYGLQAGIFTNDWRRIWKAFETIEVGGLVHNDPPTYRVDMMPYGGVKMSGIGREGPRWAIEEMTEPRLLVLSTV